MTKSSGRIHPKLHRFKNCLRFCWGRQAPPKKSLRHSLPMYHVLYLHQYLEDFPVILAPLQTHISAGISIVVNEIFHPNKPYINNTTWNWVYPGIKDSTYPTLQKQLTNLHPTNQHRSIVWSSIWPVFNKQQISETNTQLGEGFFHSASFEQKGQQHKSPTAPKPSQSTN